MSIISQADELARKMQSLGDVRTRYIDKLNSCGATLEATSDFVDIINAIYNLYCTEYKSFIYLDFSDFPTGTGIFDIEVNFRRVNVVRDAIFNALQARYASPEEIDTLYDMVDRIDDIDSETVVRMEPENITMSAFSTNATTITINNYDMSKRYKYNINGKYDPDNVILWRDLIAQSTTINCERTDTICIVELDNETIFYGTVNVATLVDPNEIELSFDYGKKEDCTIPTINSTLPYSSVYYSIEPYKNLHQLDLFYGTDSTGTDFEKWDFESEFYVGFSDPLVYVILTNENDLVVGAGSAKAKSGFIANTIFVESEAGSDYGYTKISVDNILTANNCYKYKMGAYTPMYNESTESLGLTDWDGVSDIQVNQNQIITVFEVTISNKIRKYGQVVASVKLHELGIIDITSVKTEEDLESIITIETPKIDPNNKWFYKYQDDASLPDYGENIDESYMEESNSTFTVLQKNGTKMLLVEYNSTDHIIAAGSVTINSIDPHVKILLLTSDLGTSLGYTKVTVVSPEKDPNNVYIYTKGNAPIVYGTPLRGWTQWNGTDEITGFVDGDIITVAEVEHTNFELRKVGIINAKPRPIELLPLSIFSKAGSFDRYTYISVSPKRTDDSHEFRYAFNVHTPALYDNVSSWMLWDGISEIFVPESYGDTPTIVFSECTSEHLTIKAGSTVTIIKMPDPKLNPIEFVLTDGSSENTAVVNINTSIPDNICIYKYLYMEEIIDMDDPNNYHWDCTGWNLLSGEIPYEEGRRLYISACTDNELAEYMGTIIASKSTL